MKRFFLAFAAAAILASHAFADDRLRANVSVNELPTLDINSIASGDFVPVYDTSAIDWKKVPATALGQAAAFEDSTATNILTASECGKTLMLNSATEFVTTLPVPTAGCRFVFIVKAAPSGASYTVVTNASANIIIGHVETADVNGAVADGDVSTADDTITIVDGVAVVGDQVEIYSDGTSWYYIGHARTYNGITANQAS